MENIDVVFYINLAHRVDRKEHFLKEIKRLCVDETKVRRIDAFHNGNGSLGCATSHVLAMEEFYANPDCNTCAIFEDDFTFRSDNVEENNRLIRDCMTHFPEWDMIGLSYNSLECVDTPYPSIKKASSYQTSSGYVVTRKYLPTLATNFAEAADNLQVHGHIHEYCCDQYWKRLQPSANWYCIVPSIGYQCGGYSDIERTYTEYKC